LEGEAPEHRLEGEAPDHRSKGEAPERRLEGEAPEHWSKGEALERGSKGEAPERGLKSEAPDRGSKGEAPERGLDGEAPERRYTQISTHEIRNLNFIAWCRRHNVGRGLLPTLDYIVEGMGEKALCAKGRSGAVAWRSTGFLRLS
jgi:hypothetical protein